MRRQLLVLAAGGVLLTGCLGGRSEVPTGSCPAPLGADCYYDDDVLIGPSTYRVPGSRYVFDVPAGWWVSMTEDWQPPAVRLVRIAAPQNAWLWIDPHTGEEVARYIRFGPDGRIGHFPGGAPEMDRGSAMFGGELARIPVEVLFLFDDIVASIRVGE